MADPKEEKNPPQEPEGAGDAQPPAPSPGAAPPLDEMVEAAIGRLAASGKIFGGEEGSRQPESPPPSSEGQAGGLDLDGAITRVLERREQESKAKEQQQSLQEKVEKLEKSAAERVKKWWEPWSPWS